jgi:DNA-binding CsgD family transcriptional regulator
VYPSRGPANGSSCSRRRWPPGARDPLSGESIAKAIRAVDVGAASYYGVQAARAVATSTAGRQPEFLFGALARGSLGELISPLEWSGYRQRQSGHSFGVSAWKACTCAELRSTQMAQLKIGSNLPRTVGRAAERICATRGSEDAVMRTFNRSHVPMVMVDDHRRHIDANRAARLVLRLSLEDWRRYTVDDLVAPSRIEQMKDEWERLMDTGVVTGSNYISGPDGGVLRLIYCGIARVLPGLHLTVFAPAGWPDDELAQFASDVPRVPLSPREREVLQLAADGLTGPMVAERLVLSPGTVKTHFAHIYEKLGVGDRAAAVATGLRLGLID